MKKFTKSLVLTLASSALVLAMVSCQNPSGSNSKDNKNEQSGGASGSSASAEKADQKVAESTPKSGAAKSIASEEEAKELLAAAFTEENLEGIQAAFQAISKSFDTKNARFITSNRAAMADVVEDVMTVPEDFKEHFEKLQNEKLPELMEGKEVSDSYKKYFNWGSIDFGIPELKANVEKVGAEYKVTAKIDNFNKDTGTGKVNGKGSAKAVVKADASFNLKDYLAKNKETENLKNSIVGISLATDSDASYSVSVKDLDIGEIMGAMGPMDNSMRAVGEQPDSINHDGMDGGDPTELIMAMLEKLTINAKVNYNTAGAVTLCADGLGGKLVASIQMKLDLDQSKIAGLMEDLMPLMMGEEAKSYESNVKQDDNFDMEKIYSLLDKYVTYTAKVAMCNDDGNEILVLLDANKVSDIMNSELYKMIEEMGLFEKHAEERM